MNSLLTLLADLLKIDTRQRKRERAMATSPYWDPSTYNQVFNKDPLS